MSKLFSLIFCAALLALPMSMGCNGGTDTAPIGAEEGAVEEGAVEEVEMEQP